MMQMWKIVIVLSRQVTDEVMIAVKGRNTLKKLQQSVAMVCAKWGPFKLKYTAYKAAWFMKNLKVIHYFFNF